jgi:hypothetical protein
VSKRLRGFPILESHFFAKTQLVLGMARSRCHFAFVPKTLITLVGSTNSNVSFQSVSFVVGGDKEIRVGKLAPQRAEMLA